MSCFEPVLHLSSVFLQCKNTELWGREGHCWLTVPWTHSRGPWAPCGKACHSGSGWHCLCGRSSWSSQALAPAEAHQRCQTLESPHRSASLEVKCQGRQTYIFTEEEEKEGYSKEMLTESVCSKFLTLEINLNSISVYSTTVFHTCITIHTVSSDAETMYWAQEK